MGEDHSSAGPDGGQFDKTGRSTVLGAGRLLSGRLWLSYTGSIGNRSMRLPGGVVVRPKTPNTFLAQQRVSLRDRPVFFVELNKHERLVDLPKFDNHDANIRRINRNGVNCFPR
jgi:hypothetical protein